MPPPVSVSANEKSKPWACAPTLLRWCKFNLVGAAGFLVQFAVLLFLKSVLHLHYLAATALAVEAAVLHNFFWHERFTWSERTRSDRTKTDATKTDATNTDATKTDRTKADRTCPGCATSGLRVPSFKRLLRFNFTTGLVSVVGNLGMMRVLVGFGHIHYLVANAIAIAVCSLANFLVSDGWVFAK